MSEYSAVLIFANTGSIPSPPIPRTRRVIQVAMIVDSHLVSWFGVVDAISRTDDVLDEVDDTHCSSLWIVMAGVPRVLSETQFSCCLRPRYQPSSDSTA